VVEDDPQLGPALKARLESQHHATDLLTGGADGLVAATAVPYDLLIVDVLLPGLGGFALCRELRAKRSAFAGRLDAHPQGKTILLLIVGTIPVGLAGLLLENPIKAIFFSSQWPVIPAAFLCLNGAILFVGEQLRRRSEPDVHDRYKQEQAFKRIPQLTFLQATWIGAAQTFALIPGISRSGIAMVAGMVAGMGARLNQAEAARFSFLLPTPVILLAGLLEVPKLFDAPPTTLVIAVIGAIVSGIAAFLSVRFLTAYFQVG
jgi:undecaprenyl pyrophosphate phosphatase UppP